MSIDVILAPERAINEANGTFAIAGPGLELTFTCSAGRLALVQVQRKDGPGLLWEDADKMRSGPGTLGNPLAIVVTRGEEQGNSFGLESFRLQRCEQSETRLLATLTHDHLPLLFTLEIRVEGNVASWRGQATWNGSESWEADFYFPCFSRIVFAGSGNDRVLLPANSGSERRALDTMTVSRTYLGNLSCPVLLVEGGGHGLAFLDDNMADLGADAGACIRRGFAAGRDFPPPLEAKSSVLKESSQPPCHALGPYVAAVLTHRFRAADEVNIPARELEAERHGSEELHPERLGDSVDLGPVRMYAYQGEWQVGASWLRERRQHVPMRRSPAPWWESSSFLSETLGDAMVRRGQSFHDYPTILEEKRQMGSDLFHLPGFHDPEILGEERNWLNRGDYHYAAENLGGLSAARQGIASVHRRGGHILYYVEGLIVWKRSRIGRSRGRDWALMHEDGSYLEHYKGFWHPCPACPDWADWLARTCAEVVRTTGVDGFFIDSIGATRFHRCFNPAHHHPHPDVWNWGVRNLLRRVREEVDKVNPETILIIEGAADLAREFVDGSLSHTHDWGGKTFTVPLVRFLHADMHIFESWGGSAPPPGNPRETPQSLHIWNAVFGHRIYAHDPQREHVAEIARRTRFYYDAFPEIYQAPLGGRDVKVEGVGTISALFESSPAVLTLGNTAAESRTAILSVPAEIAAGVLLDRVTGERFPVIRGAATIDLAPFDYRAFEVRR